MIDGLESGRFWRARSRRGKSGKQVRLRRRVRRPWRRISGCNFWRASSTTRYVRILYRYLCLCVYHGYCLLYIYGRKKDTLEGAEGNNLLFRVARYGNPSPPRCGGCVCGTGQVYGSRVTRARATVHSFLWMECHVRDPQRARALTHTHTALPPRVISAARSTSDLSPVVRHGPMIFSLETFLVYTYQPSSFKFIYRG